MNGVLARAAEAVDAVGVAAGDVDRAAVAGEVADRSKRSDQERGCAFCAALFVFPAFRPVMIRAGERIVFRQVNELGRKSGICGGRGPLG